MSRFLLLSVPPLLKYGFEVCKSLYSVFMSNFYCVPTFLNWGCKLCASAHVHIFSIHSYILFFCKLYVLISYILGAVQ